jgi:hypothetical protein
VAAGEDIRIAEATPTLLALGDFWLFDNQAVFMMEYDQEGRFLGSSQVLEPLNIYRQMKHLALSSSTPYLEFATRRAG